MEETRSKKFWVLYVATVVVAFVMVMAMCAMAPAKAHAAETGNNLTAASVATTEQVKTLQAQSVTAAKAKATKTTKSTAAKKVTNPYKDVISGKTVDKTGYNAIKYVKAHKGFDGVINGKRFYPGKTFSQAQFTKILRNFYGNTVALSKSKTAVTGKWACAKLQNVAKTTFGVKMKWKSGATNTKLTRTGCSNYIKKFATWSGGLFAPDK